MISFNLSNDLGLLHFLERFGAIALGNVIEVVVVVVVGGMGGGGDDCKFSRPISIH